MFTGILGISVAVVSAGTAPVQKLTVNMTEFQFTPKMLALKPGTTVQLTLVNKGSVQHEFMLYTMPIGMSMNINMDEYGSKNTYFQGIGDIEVTYPGKKPARVQRLAKVDVDPGNTVTIGFAAKKTGAFEFGCHLAGHYEAGMKGALNVR